MFSSHAISRLEATHQGKHNRRQREDCFKTKRHIHLPSPQAPSHPLHDQRTPEVTHGVHRSRLHRFFFHRILYPARDKHWRRGASHKKLVPLADRKRKTLRVLVHSRKGTSSLSLFSIYATNLVVDFLFCCQFLNT